MSTSTNTQMEQALEEAPLIRSDEESRYGLSQFQLMWRKFLRSRMAIGGGIAILAFYLVAIFANFLAPYGGDQRFTDYLYAPPQGLHFDFQHGLYVFGLEKKVDLDTLRTTYKSDTQRIIPVKFFVHDKPYKLMGLFDTDVHLYGIAEKDLGLFFLGSDRQGRDMFSRILIGSQTSLTIGLVGVFISLIIGSIMGVTSGYYGGQA